MTDSPLYPRLEEARDKGARAATQPGRPYNPYRPGTPLWNEFEAGYEAVRERTADPTGRLPKEGVGDGRRPPPPGAAGRSAGNGVCGQCGDDLAVVFGMLWCGLCGDHRGEA